MAKAPKTNFRVTVQWPGFQTDTYHATTSLSEGSVKEDARWWFVQKHGVPLFDEIGPTPTFLVERA